MTYNISSSSNILSNRIIFSRCSQGDKGEKNTALFCLVYFTLFFYYYKGCERSVNQSFGWLNFTKSDYSTLNCSIQINNAGVNHGFALISFQYINLGYCR